MRKAIVMLALLASVWGAQRHEGFLGNVWGTPFPRMKETYDLREIAVEKERITCASNIQRLGNADIEECNLEFVRNRFSGVVILTTGRRNADHLLLYLRQILGEGRSYDPTAISWTKGNVHVSFDVDSFGDAYVYWYCLNYQ